MLVSGGSSRHKDCHILASLYIYCVGIALTDYLPCKKTWSNIIYFLTPSYHNNQEASRPQSHELASTV
ncbi:hypothetical protein BDV29DRAFT_115905 [Aspergillus leporis]|uniref:Uncharacterized protein n=1 Tax=Aspergillus leporis TaxID=41062 RepID=A0A5N5X202_9EURO|nr:hypothetical protein BDV29DRAFT_115905 [Aspergillus leporis]